jgi:peptidoglycan/xylan/chitin deacetylase (PgdA/CDA1 family)
MDPDSSPAQPYFQAAYAASQAITATFITVAFYACRSHAAETGPVSKPANGAIPLSHVQSEKRFVPPAKKKKTIYLTFDDGPNKGTRKMMHIIEEEQVPVTLFIIGEQVYGSREQSAVFDSVVHSSYFEIANHSYTHAFHNKYAKFYTVPDSVLKDFIRCADSLHLTANIIRTPGRNIWRAGNISSTDIKASGATADSLQARGFTEIGWDLEWRFDRNNNLVNSSDDMIREIDSVFAKGKTKTPNHLVLLAHDQVYADAGDSSELHLLIKKLKASDEYDFETISKYPGIRN